MLGETGPLIVHNCENAVQAIARDVLAHGLTAADDEGLNLVLHVHDEGCAEEDEAQADDKLALLLDCLTRRPWWCPDAPLRAEGWTGRIYRK